MYVVWQWLRTTGGVRSHSYSPHNAQLFTTNNLLTTHIPQRRCTYVRMVHMYVRTWKLGKDGNGVYITCIYIHVCYMYNTSCSVK